MTPGLDGLVVWLTQIRDEDEQARLDELRAMSLVRVVAHPNQQTGQRLAMCDSCDGGWFAEGSRIEMEGAEMEHLREKHDHEVTLARITADRQILSLHKPIEVHVMRTVVDGRWVPETALGCEYCAGLCHSRSGLGCADDGLDAPYPCATIRLLAMPYADRSGYLEEWRP